MTSSCIVSLEHPFPRMYTIPGMTMAFCVLQPRQIPLFAATLERKGSTDFARFMHYVVEDRDIAMSHDFDPHSGLSDQSSSASTDPARILERKLASILEIFRQALSDFVIKRMKLVLGAEVYIVYLLESRRQRYSSQDFGNVQERDLNLSTIELLNIIKKRWIAVFSDSGLAQPGSREIMDRIRNFASMKDKGQCPSVADIKQLASNCKHLMALMKSESIEYIDIILQGGSVEAAKPKNTVTHPPLSNQTPGMATAAGVSVGNYQNPTFSQPASQSNNFDHCPSVKPEHSIHSQQHQKQGYHRNDCTIPPSHTGAHDENASHLIFTHPTDKFLVSTDGPEHHPLSFSHSSQEPPLAWQPLSSEIALSELDCAMDLEPSANHQAEQRNDPNSNVAVNLGVMHSFLTGLDISPLLNTHHAALDKGLIVMDGSNIAWHHGANLRFSWRGVILALLYWVDQSYSCVAFVPESRLGLNPSVAANVAHSSTMGNMDFHALALLVQNGMIVPTPLNDYDDSYLIHYSRKSAGLVVSNDRFADHLHQEQAISHEAKESLESYLRHCRISFTFRKDEFLPNPSFDILRALEYARKNIPRKG